MNPTLLTAVLSVIAINANNYVLMGDSMFEDCGLKFDLLTPREEALYDMYFKDAISRHTYDETIRLKEDAITRANDWLVRRAA